MLLLLPFFLFFELFGFWGWGRGSFDKKNGENYIIAVISHSNNSTSAFLQLESFSTSTSVHLLY